MTVNQILGISFGVAAALFAFAGARLERYIDRYGVDAVTLTTPGTRMLIASGIITIAGPLLALGATLAA